MAQGSILSLLNLASLRRVIEQQEQILTTLKEMESQMSNLNQSVEDLQAAVQGVQHTGRADDRMPREFQLAVEVKDPGRPGSALPDQEDGLEVSQFLGDLGHLRVAEPHRVGKHSEAVTAVRAAREDVDVLVAHDDDGIERQGSRELGRMACPL